MSYPMDLDEYEEWQLRRELHDRAEYRAKGCCDYCHRPYESEPCRFPERHKPLSESLHLCDNCGRTWREEQIVPFERVPDLTQRIEPGGEVPSGECTGCGALCYLVKEGG